MGLPDYIRSGLSPGDEATVVGVIDDVRYLTAADSTRPEMYYSYRQFKGRVAVPVATLLVRSAGDPRALGPTLRAVVATQTVAWCQTRSQRWKTKC